MASRHPLIPAVAALLAVATSLPAGADVEEARRLLDEGRAGQALRVLDEQLEGSPQDAEARFLRGLALSRTGRREEAIAVFQKLTRDYPQLPEPYNNLAVIYAQQGDYEQARDARDGEPQRRRAGRAAHPQRRPRIGRQHRIDTRRRGLRTRRRWRFHLQPDPGRQRAHGIVAAGAGQR
ncbi:tetratricopeptide repeat protein [Algiphilus sp.]|uniref:tetratricopeptide repeat protein n=1 Tax=Algiphilus sp. TaxID=1872431 RepID=UPI003C414EB8